MDDDDDDDDVLYERETSSLTIRKVHRIMIIYMKTNL
jgi:hypothetical protein